MITDTGGLDDAVGGNEGMFANLQGEEGGAAGGDAGGGAEGAGGGDEGVFGYCYAGCVGRRGGGGGGGGGGGIIIGGGRGLADKITADADVWLDYHAAAEDHVLGAVELGATGDFIAGVGFDVGGFGFGGHCCGPGWREKCRYLVVMRLLLMLRL